MGEHREKSVAINDKTGNALRLIFYAFAAHYVAVLAHEYSHSFMAWLLGDKGNPLLIDYGGTSWANLLLLSKVDESVNYSKILADGHVWHIALIAFAGAGIGNGLGYLLSRKKVLNQKAKIRLGNFQFYFWLNFMSIANFYDYVPVRTITTHGDMANLATGLSTSNWVILSVLSPIVIWSVWDFFFRTLPKSYSLLGVENGRERFMNGFTFTAFCSAVPNATDGRGIGYHCKESIITRASKYSKITRWLYYKFGTGVLNAP